MIKHWLYKKFELKFKIEFDFESYQCSSNKKKENLLFI